MESGRKLTIIFEEIKFVLDTHIQDLHHYLDSETGRVLMVGEVTRAQLETILRQLGDVVSLEMVFDAIQRADCRDWERPLLREAAQVEFGYQSRYLEIPQAESWQSYEDMVSFMETISNERLRVQLEVASQGKGAFRRFGDVLAGYPGERARWFKFHDECIRRRAENWLSAVHIKPEWA
jgi:hypothetical protein